MLSSMDACKSCGTVNRAGARFCDGCGAPLATQVPSREERRTVTVLFADLAGFTSRSENLDPEDVRAFLVPYYDVLTAEVTAHGGIVDRFLGDGIMAVFGAPTAHEDDPERAVRAALRILERIQNLGLDLQVRIGINTGPVLFAAGAGDRDDSITGDTVNTAARLQTLAPIDAIVVGKATYRRTSRRFTYEARPLAAVKGKAEPVAAWRVVAPRAGVGVNPDGQDGTPYIGRAVELSRLQDLFAKTIAARAAQLVLVTGEPGIGKSRIVSEFGARLEALPTLVAWRQGRSLPYGTSTTFWALGEILKAHAGILESDAPDWVRSKLEAVLPAGPDQAWFRQRLLPLLGMEATSSADQAELFTAWRRFFETIAERVPLVLVFEDLHWADNALLAFLEHLANRAEAVPLLVVGTARPELFDRHPGFAADLRGATRINLAPLSDDETARFVAALLEAREIPAGLRDLISQRAEGNPLYAEECVRLLRDLDLLTTEDGTVVLRAGAEVPLPDFDPRPHRRSARHAPDRPARGPRRCRRRRQGLLGGRRRGDGGQARG